MNSQPKPVLLDCTLRDGGYYNNWDFDIEVARKYLYAMHKAGIDVVEIGFRSLHNKSYKGPFAFSNETILREIKQELDIDIAVMIDVKEMSDSQSWEISLDKLFPLNANESVISIVRLATGFAVLDDAIKICSKLTLKGYKVCINLMQAAALSNKQLEKAALMARDCRLTAFYLADSTGSLTPAEYAEKISTISMILECPLGIHAHDNMGKALQNTLKCYELGVTWLDSTVLGMGRGPGNTDTEELLLSLEQMKSIGPVNIFPLFEISEKYFEPLRKMYCWGKNRYYFMSRMHKIHPSYVQEMMGDTRYHQSEIFGALNYLKDNDAKSFEADKLFDARSFYSEQKLGTTSLKTRINSKTALIIGSGPSAKKNNDALEYFINTSNMTVVALNNQSPIHEDLIDIRSVCHPMRLLADTAILAKTKKTILTPLSMMPSTLRQYLGSTNVLDYCISIEPGKLKSNEFSCVIPSPLAISYTLAALASVSCIRTIILAGFDGYSPGDPRNREMENLFELFLQQFRYIDLFSVTPTCYNSIETKSIHGLLK